LGRAKNCYASLDCGGDVYCFWFDDSFYEMTLILRINNGLTRI
jgi:hypothetical protein